MKPVMMIVVAGLLQGCADNFHDADMLYAEHTINECVARRLGEPVRDLPNIDYTDAMLNDSETGGVANGLYVRNASASWIVIRNNYSKYDALYEELLHHYGVSHLEMASFEYFGTGGRSTPLPRMPRPVVSCFW